MKDIKLILLIALGFFLVNACSTEKNTLINRTYHGINAHYNGYFNANELIRQSLETYSASRVENYYELIPIDPLPNVSMSCNLNINDLLEREIVSPKVELLEKNILNQNSPCPFQIKISNNSQ